MSLAPLVRLLGGELYDHGRRASVPGPGHSAHDRSVSLWLQDGRVVVHSFGRSTWREVLDDLRRRGLVDGSGRPASSVAVLGRCAPVRPDAGERVRMARGLWDEAAPLTRQVSLLHVRRRAIRRPGPVSPALRHHPGAPSAVYAGLGLRRPALLAAVSDRRGALCAVELTYLDPNGDPAHGVRIPRKVIGALPTACAVRLDPAAEELLVGEGVFTTLSASTRFALPGWALLSTRNLRTWSAPEGVRSVLIAADRGAEGERSAAMLAARLGAEGVRTRVALPPQPAGDWNDLDTQTGRSREERGGGLRVR